MFYVYVLKSESYPNWHYIRSSGNPEQRIKRHNYGQVRSTKGRRPFSLIYKEPYTTRSKAYRIEMYYKTVEGKTELKKKLIDLGVW